jgi:hypothetical protein
MIDDLMDKRLNQASHKQAPVDEVIEMIEEYQRKHMGGFLRSRQL